MSQQPVRMDRTWYYPHHCPFRNRFQSRRYD